MLSNKLTRKRRVGLVDVGTLLLRLTFGGLLAGHGAQKLFGWFEGPGLDGTTKWLGSLGVRPPRFWALLAGLSEFGGGLLTGLGFMQPVGQLGVMGAMSMATAKVHADKPIWSTRGGAELPLTNMAIAASLMLTGPGRLSLDEALGTKLPRWIALPGLAAVAAAVAVGLRSSAERPASHRMNHRAHASS